MSYDEIKKQEKETIMKRMIEEKKLNTKEEQIKYLEEWKWQLDMIDHWSRETSEKYDILTELIHELKGEK